ncbi:MAG: O-antigen ligase family protein [Kiritimatiellia bacterium]|nr:O-antigen ligase family protein [Kiritimatiellia bacterium]
MSIQDRLPSLLFWAGIVAVTAVLALWTVASPVWPLLCLAVFALLCFVFLRTSTAILWSVFLYYLLFRLVIHFEGPVRTRPEVVYVGTGLAVLVPYVVWLIKHLTGIDQRPCKNTYQPLIGFLFLCGAVSLLWTSDPVHGSILLFVMAVNFMIVQLVTVYIQTEADLRRFIAFVTGCGFALACLVLPSRNFYFSWNYEMWSGVTLAYEIGGDVLGPNPDLLRASGFAQVDLAGAGLTTFLFITLAMFFGAKRRAMRLLLLGLFQLLLTSLILTGAKASAGAFLVGFYVVLLLAPSLKGRRIPALMLGTGALVLAFLTTGLLMGERRIVKSVQTSEAGSTGAKSLFGRFEIWRKVFKDFKSFLYLFFGEGLGTSAAKPETLPHAHSHYVSSFVDLGLVGFSLFMTISAKGLIELLINIKHRHNLFLRDTMVCLLGALISVLIMGLVYQEFTFPFFWMVIAMVAAVTMRSKTLDAEPEASNRSQNRAKRENE